VIDPLLADRPLTSYVIANAIGMLVSYSGTKSWVFRDRRTNYADGGFVAYTVINVATMALPVACLWLSREVLGLTDPVSDNVSANVIGLAMGFTARFYLFRRFVFRRHDITPSVRAVAPLNGSTGRSSGDPARRADRASAAD
jgi:putative flippase GtrA